MATTEAMLRLDGDPAPPPAPAAGHYDRKQKKQRKSEVTEEDEQTMFHDDGTPITPKVGMDCGPFRLSKKVHTLYGELLGYNAGRKVAPVPGQSSKKVRIYMCGKPSLNCLK